MAGIDKSDFQPLGRPQLSSTIGTHLDDLASLTRGNYRDVQAKTDVLSLPGNGLPPLPGGLGDTTAPRSSSLVKESLHEDGRLDGTFSKSAGDPGVREEVELDRYSKPGSHHGSGSEHSFCSQTSFDKVAFSKTFQTEASEQKSNSNSHRSSSHHSNGSHGYNKSYAHSHASHSNGSYSGLSGRSSISEIISDKADSIGSVGSRTRGKGRLVTVDQSGSEGSMGKVYPGRETLGGLRGQSDNESF